MRSGKEVGGMDALVIVDALAVVMGHEEKDLCKPAKRALNIILNTATLILGSKDLVNKNVFLFESIANNKMLDVE